MKSRLLAVLIGVAMMCGVVIAQEATEKTSSTPGTKSAVVASYYRLDFVVKELDAEKVLSKKSYSLTARVSGNREFSRLRAGSRIPVPVESSANGGKNIQYIDVGMNIDCTTIPDGDSLVLDIGTELSSIPPDAPAAYGPGQAPLVRQLKSQNMVKLTPNKPTLVFSADTSSRTIELEVTATKL